jgi:hypothetical protein
MGELLREDIAVPVRCGVRGAVGHRPDPDPGMTVGRVDGIECGGCHWISNVRHDSEDLDLVALLQDIGHSDRRGIIPPPGEIGVDDDALGLPFAVATDAVALSVNPDRPVAMMHAMRSATVENRVRSCLARVEPRDSRTSLRPFPVEVTVAPP